MFQSSYLETLAPRECSPYALFAYPFVEAKRNFTLSIQCEHTMPLDERIAHFVLAIFLLIPILNTLIFLALRDTYGVRVSRDAANVSLGRETIQPEIAAQLDALNGERNQMVIDQQMQLEGSTERASYTPKLNKIEWEAASIMPKFLTEKVAAHFRRSARFSDSVTYYDGRLPSRSSRILRYHGSSEVTFRPIRSLNQQSGSNQLCGHYALFFMLQVVNGNSPLDRTAFNEIINEWADLLATKRVASSLSQRRGEGMSFGYKNVSISGISFGEIKFLIQNSRFTESLRTNEHCFYMDLEEILEVHEYAKPTTPLAQSDRIATTFPLHFILKGGGHFYFCTALSPTEFRMMDSFSCGIGFDSVTLDRFVQQVNKLTAGQ